LYKLELTQLEQFIGEVVEIEEEQVPSTSSSTESQASEEYYASTEIFTR